MRTVKLASLLVCTLLAGAAVAQQAEPQKFGVPGKGNLLLNIPQGWRVTNNGIADPAAAIVRMRPESGDAFYLQVTALWIPLAERDRLTDETLRSRVEGSAKRMLPRAVEKEATLIALRGKQAAGYHFTLTDRTSTNTGDNYRYVVQGTVRSGEVLTVFTLLQRDPALPENERVLRMFADASFVPGEAAPNPPPPDYLQIAKLDTTYELSVPISKLTMTVPRGQLVQTPGGGGNHPRYFSFSDGALNVSGWFEPAGQYRGMNAFWENETRAWKTRGLPEPRNVQFAKFSNWEAVLYDIDLSAAGNASAASNTHIRAHWIQDGTWIDLHLSLTASAPVAEVRARLQAFLETVQVKEKP
jgi:hypothetical protein